MFLLTLAAGNMNAMNGMHMVSSKLSSVAKNYALPLAAWYAGSMLAVLGHELGHALTARALANNSQAPSYIHAGAMTEKIMGSSAELICSFNIGSIKMGLARYPKFMIPLPIFGECYFANPTHFSQLPAIYAAGPITGALTSGMIAWLNHRSLKSKGLHHGMYATAQSHILVNFCSPFNGTDGKLLAQFLKISHRYVALGGLMLAVAQHKLFYPNQSIK